MFLTRSEYDRGVNTFSPEGRLFQVEYAIEAIKIGTTAIGICTTEGIVIAVEKRLLSVLQEPGSVEKIFEVDSHIGVAMSGLSADARTLVDHARSETQYHRFTFNEPMPVESLTQSVCDLALKFGEAGEEVTNPTLTHTTHPDPPHHSPSPSPHLHCRAPWSDLTLTSTPASPQP
tara:strand:+ start:93 stop:617 length:525 start_codon:yes stop_codon:yes gene_type:complete